MTQEGVSLRKGDTLRCVQSSFVCLFVCFVQPTSETLNSLPHKPKHFLDLKRPKANVSEKFNSPYFSNAVDEFVHYN